MDGPFPYKNNDLVYYEFTIETLWTNGYTKLFYKFHNNFSRVKQNLKAQSGFFS